MAKIYVCHAYIKGFEGCMEEMEKELESSDFDTFLPVGETDELKIKSINDRGMDASDGLIGCTRHGLDGLMTLGQSYEIIGMIQMQKPTVLWCDKDSYLLNHYLPKSIDCLYVTSNLDEAIQIFKTELRGLKHLQLTSLI